MTEQSVQATSTNQPKSTPGVAALTVFLWAVSMFIVTVLCNLFFQLGQDNARKSWWDSAGQAYPYPNNAHTLLVLIVVTSALLGIVVAYAVRVTCDWMNPTK